MPVELNESGFQKLSRLHPAFSGIHRFLQPDPNEHGLCQELEYQWRDRNYTPMLTVWMFILQTISADKSCQHTVNKINAGRVAQVLAKVQQRDHRVLQSENPLV